MSEFERGTLKCLKLQLTDGKCPRVLAKDAALFKKGMKIAHGSGVVYPIPENICGEILFSEEDPHAIEVVIYPELYD